MPGQRYAWEGPEKDTVVVQLPGQRPVVVPLAVALALRYDITHVAPVVPRNSSWWYTVVGRCVKCCGLDPRDCKCQPAARQRKTQWQDTEHGRPKANELRREWLRRERAQAMVDRRCTRCLKRRADEGMRTCGKCRTRFAEYRENSKMRKSQENGGD